MSDQDPSLKALREINSSQLNEFALSVANLALRNFDESSMVSNISSLPMRPFGDALVTNYLKDGVHMSPGFFIDDTNIANINTTPGYRHKLFNVSVKYPQESEGDNYLVRSEYFSAEDHGGGLQAHYSSKIHVVDEGGNHLGEPNYQEMAALLKTDPDKFREITVEQAKKDTELFDLKRSLGEYMFSEERFARLQSLFASLSSEHIKED